MTADNFTKFIDGIRGNGKQGNAVYSVCSAHAAVIEAAMVQASNMNMPLVIEATSNQVNQYGGYTGMIPADFVNYIRAIAEQCDYPFENIILGGDHLGPNVWKDEPASEAMEKAAVLVSAFVKAGFRKIHLDASMFCSDDIGNRDEPLPDNLVAERTALLCRTAETAYVEKKGNPIKPVYIIGTEVPVPGGAQEQENSVTPTSRASALRTLESIQKEFFNNSLNNAWDRVIALVVQPGVEFGDEQVFQYNRQAAAELVTALDAYPSLVFEAHSTDYQSESSLQALAEDRFRILKIGPWLTFAYREALYALESIELELNKLGAFDQLSSLRRGVEEVLMKNPRYWKQYYMDDNKLRFRFSYSFSDRVRYYWETEQLKESVEILYSNLRNREIPLSLISQYFNEAFLSIVDGTLECDPHALVLYRIQSVLQVYARACTARSDTGR